MIITIMASKGVYCGCLFCCTYICTEVFALPNGKNAGASGTIVGKKKLLLWKFWKIFSPIFCIIEIISVILFIWEKNHCQMVNIHLYL